MFLLKWIFHWIADKNKQTFLINLRQKINILHGILFVTFLTVYLIHTLDNDIFIKMNVIVFNEPQEVVCTYVIRR